MQTDTVDIPRSPRSHVWLIVHNNLVVPSEPPFNVQFRPIDNRLDLTALSASELNDERRVPV